MADTTRQKQFALEFETQINQLQVCNNGALGLSIAVKTQYCSERWTLGNELNEVYVVG